MECIRRTWICTNSSDDPVFLYQDIVIAIDEGLTINNGQPALHARCLAALHVQESETVVHIGAGTAYYTAILAELVGPSGEVFAYEIEENLAQKASKNLSRHTNVTVHACSGAQGQLPSCDVIYINAGATAPLDSWLDALRLNGRLLFPLTPDGLGQMPGAGGMLLITRIAEERFDARFILPAMFIPCIGARDETTAKKLAQAFGRGDSGKVRSLHRRTSPDETCWVSGDDWWLSVAENR
jgi:protein-L-isoaspartate(D-aspartate) O-methyltransferase